MAATTETPAETAEMPGPPRIPGPQQARVNLNECERCGKAHPSRQAKYSHKRSCTGTIRNDPDLQRTIRDLQERLAIVESANAATATTTINNTINNTINQVNIVVHNFMSEKIPYITQAILNERMLACGDGVIATIADIHFNALHPENKTVRLKSKKQGTVEVRRNGEWKIAPLKAVTENLLERSYGLVMGDLAFASEVYEKKPHIQEWHMKFRMKSVMGPLIERTHCLLMNERNPGA